METTTTLAKADLGKRFGASLIDGVIVAVAIGLLSMGGQLLGGIATLAGASYILLRDGLSLSFADHRSIGKQLLGLNVVLLDGGTMTPELSARRNWPLALGSIISGIGGLLWGLGLGFIGGSLTMIGSIAGLLGLVEAVLVLVNDDGRRIGDKMAKTQVVG